MKRLLPAVTVLTVAASVSFGDYPICDNPENPNPGYDLQYESNGHVCRGSDIFVVHDEEDEVGYVWIDNNHVTSAPTSPFAAHLYGGGHGQPHDEQAQFYYDSFGHITDPTPTGCGYGTAKVCRPHIPKDRRRNCPPLPSIRKRDNSDPMGHRHDFIFEGRWYAYYHSGWVWNYGTQEYKEMKMPDCHVRPNLP